MSKQSDRNYVEIFEDKQIKIKIEKIIFKIIDKLTDSDFVKDTINNESNKITYMDKKISPWSDTSLSSGYPSVCAFLGEFSEHYPDDKWDKVAYNYVLKINSCLKECGMLSDSIFEGFSGIGLAVTTLSKNGIRYQKFIAQINKLIIDCIKELVPIYERRLYSNDVHQSDYDVISGVAGTGRYLLLYKENPEALNALKVILSYLVKLTKDKNLDGYLVPGWHITAKNQFLDSEKIIFPDGNFNMGLSHGIPGPLSLLSLCLMEGVEVEGQKEAIKKISEWLIKFRVKTDKGYFWNFNVDWNEFKEGKIKRKYNSRMAWCYGTPGVARAMYLAGGALKNEHYINISIEAIDSIFKVDKNIWGIYSPTFCHGYAGFLHILNLMYSDTREVRFKNYILILTKMILDKYDDDSVFGFYNYEAIDEKVEKSLDIGLLSGVCGICLVLLGLIKPIKTYWDSVFLLI